MAKTPHVVADDCWKVALPLFRWILTNQLSWIPQTCNLHLNGLQQSLINCNNNSWKYLDICNIVTKSTFAIKNNTRACANIVYISSFLFFVLHHQSLLSTFFIKHHVYSQIRHSSKRSQSNPHSQHWIWNLKFEIVLGSLKSAFDWNDLFKI